MTEDYKLEISLTHNEYEIANNYQNNLEKILNKPISLEKAFKVAMFHTNHINSIELAMSDNATKPVAKQKTGRQATLLGGGF